MASFLCNNLDHYTEWLCLHILIHKIVSLTTKFDWKTQNSDYLLEIKLANRGATTEICQGTVPYNLGLIHYWNCYKIKGKTLLETWIYCILREGSDVIKSIKYQVFSLKYQLKQFVLMSLIQKCNICRPMLGKIWVFTSPGMIRLPWRRVWLLSSGHHCQVHVIFFQILKRTDLKECALPGQSTAQSHIITATFAIKSWIYCILPPMQEPEKSLM